MISDGLPACGGGVSLALCERPWAYQYVSGRRSQPAGNPPLPPLCSHHETEGGGWECVVDA